MRKRDRDRAEALRLAGGPPPSLRDRAVARALERGEVRTRDLTDAGIPRCYPSRMCEEGLLAKFGQGRYRAVIPKAAESRRVVANCGLSTLPTPTARSGPQTSVGIPSFNTTRRNQ